MSDTIARDDARPAGMRELLKNRNFKFLWLGQIISDFGDSMTNLALLIMVMQITGSTAALATMLIALTVPQITIGLLAGVYVDRIDRKRIMILSDLLRGFLVLGFMLSGSADTIWVLYVVAFLQASVGTFFTPARHAIIPNIVPADSLMAANSIAQTSRIIMGVVGAGAAGVLIGMLNTYWPIFVLDAFTFFISLALISRIVLKPSDQPAVSAPRATVGTILGELREGMGIIFRTRILAGTMMALTIAMLGFGAVNVLLVPFVVDDLQMPTTWFGVLQFAQTAAMVLSGGLVAVLAARLRPARIVSLSMVLMGVVLASIALVTNVWTLMIALFAIGLVLTPMQASVSTIMQTAVDNSVRGRIGASLNTLISTASLLSMGMAGIFGELVGVRSVFVLAGVVALVAGVVSAMVFRQRPSVISAEPEISSAVTTPSIEPAS